MVVLYLVRHAQSVANAEGILAGRTEGVNLDDKGREQIPSITGYFSDIAIERIVHSPLLRVRQTAELLIMEHKEAVVVEDDDLIECHYGDWTNRKLSELTHEELWSTVMKKPSAVTFPNGESLLAMFQRSVNSAEKWATVSQNNAVLISHGDILKSIIAHYAGLTLDEFQQIHVGTASITKIDLSGDKAVIEPLNYASNPQLGGEVHDATHS